MRRDAFLCLQVYVYRRVRRERVNSYNTKRKPRVLSRDLCYIIIYYCACNNIIRFFGSTAKLIVAILYFMLVVIMISSWRRRRTYKQYVQYTHCTHDIPYVITMCVIILLLLYAMYAHIARETMCLLFFFHADRVANKLIYCDYPLYTIVRIEIL